MLQRASARRAWTQLDVKVKHVAHSSRAASTAARHTDPSSDDWTPPARRVGEHAPRKQDYPPSSAFAHYGTSLPPTSAQLAYANRYFLEAAPSFLSGNAKFRTLPVSSIPEVAFLGRSNVGKSSLLNALLHRTGVQIANVSSRPGRTKQMNAFGVHGVRWVDEKQQADGSKLPPLWEGRGGLVVLDMPGYGKSSQEEWGKEIMKYLVGRKQLRRTFVLIDGEHGVKGNDKNLLDMLKHHGISHQIVLSKIDKVLLPRGKVSPQILENHLPDLQKSFELARKKTTPREAHGYRPLEDLISCSAEKDVPAGSGNKLGIDNLRWAVLAATGRECLPDGNKKVLDIPSQRSGQHDRDG